MEPLGLLTSFTGPSSILHPCLLWQAHSPRNLLGFVRMTPPGLTLQVSFSWHPPCSPSPTPCYTTISRSLGTSPHLLNHRHLSYHWHPWFSPAKSGATFCTLTIFTASVGSAAPRPATNVCSPATRDTFPSASSCCPSVATGLQPGTEIDTLSGPLPVREIFAPLHGTPAFWAEFYTMFLGHTSFLPSS